MPTGNFGRMESALGIKAFTLAESGSGFVLNSKLSTGKQNNTIERELGRKAAMSVS